jgi:hypothetical protein
MNNDNNIPTSQGQVPSDTDPQGQMPTSSQGQMPSDPQQKVPIESLPQAVQDYIKELRGQAAAARKEREAEARAKQQEAEQRLAEQGEFKKLAEQHAARVQELEPIASQYSQLAELVSGQIESQIKDWPNELKAFDPGKDAPIEQRLAWLEKSKPLLEKLMQQVRSQSPGNAPSPRPASPNGSKDVDELRTRYRESGKYGF